MKIIITEGQYERLKLINEGQGSNESVMAIGDVILDKVMILIDDFIESEKGEGYIELSIDELGIPEELLKVLPLGDDFNVSLIYNVNEDIDVGFVVNANAPTQDDIWFGDEVIEEADIQVRLDINYKLDYDREMIRNEVIGALSHELHHLYEFYKRNESGATGGGREDILNQLKDQEGINDGEVNNPHSGSRFAYLVYISLSYELNARVAEVAGQLKSGDVSSDNFLDFIKSTHVWEDMVRLEQFDAKEYVENFTHTNGLTIEQYMEMWKIYFERFPKEMDGFKDVGPLSDKSDVLAFFNVWDKKFKKDSKNTMRKVSKLYARYAEDDELEKPRELRYKKGR